jgi:hypothetical protein
MENENLFEILDMAIGVKLLTQNILQIRRISNFYFSLSLTTHLCIFFRGVGGRGGV